MVRSVSNIVPSLQYLFIRLRIELSINHPYLQKHPSPMSQYPITHFHHYISLDPKDYSSLLYFPYLELPQSTQKTH